MSELVERLLAGVPTLPGYEPDRGPVFDTDRANRTMRSAVARIEALEAQLAQARECIQSLTNVCGILSQRLDAFVRATCDITDCAGDVCAMSFADVIVSNARAALAAIDAQTPAISPPEAR